MESLTVKWHILQSDCAIRPIIGTAFSWKNVLRYFGKFRRNSNVCIIRFDRLIALYIFFWLARNASFMIVKICGVREELGDVKESLCKNILSVSSRLCTSYLVRAPPQLKLPPSPTTPWTAPECARSTISNAWDFSVVGHPRISQESVKHKSSFTFTFTLLNIYEVNDKSRYIESLSPATDNDAIIAA